MNARFVGLHTRNLGTNTRQITNPFTGESLTAYIDNGMTPAETAASSTLLDKARASEPDSDGFRKVSFSGDAYAHIRLGANSAEIQIDGDETPEVVEFIFQLALASGMLVTSTIDRDVIAILPGQHHPEIGIRWPGAAQIRSAGELEAWIKAEVAKGRMV